MPDGTKIAYATLGSGPPLLKAANWLTHLEFDGTSPIWGECFSEIARSMAAANAEKQRRSGANSTGSTTLVTTLG